jgi:integrase
MKALGECVVSFEEEIALQQGRPAAQGHRASDLDGLRPEEVFRIRTENLDFGEKSIFNPFGKTKAARRKVTMTEDVLQLLKRRAMNAKSAFVFPAKGDHSRPIGSVRKAHDVAIEKAGIKGHFRLYDLRHTFATRSVAAGVDLPTLSAILGHTSIQMTMRYVHPAEEQKRFAAGKLENFRLAGSWKRWKSQAEPAISATVQ